MNHYVALLRAVNVGGRQLKMDDLRQIGSELGLTDPRTYIASGNLLFSSDQKEAALKMVLERAISKHLQAQVQVLIRTGQELERIASANPFPDAPPNKVVAIFLDRHPARDVLKGAKNVANERMALGNREIYVLYPDGVGRSKLKIPAAESGTGRNMNTVETLAQLAKDKA